MTTHTTKDGRVFTLVGTEPYTRKDGTETALDLWEGACKVCGAAYTVKTAGERKAPLEAYAQFNVVHCQQHRLSKEEVGRRFGLAVQARRHQRASSGSNA